MDSQTLSSLLQRWTDGLKAAFAAMGIVGLTIEEPWDEPELTDADQLWCGQVFTVLSEPCLWIGAGKSAWQRVGAYLQRQAGIEEPDESAVLDTYREVIAQSLVALASALSEWLELEVACVEPTTEPPPSGDARPARTIRLGTEDGLSASLCLSCSPELMQLLGDQGAAVADVHVPESRDLAIDFESVLDLDMPVSVTLGSAKIDLQRTLNLTEGSVIRLNGTPSDLMQLLINGRCIAQGELVAARGQYAIKIHHVSGAERLAQVQAIGSPEQKTLPPSL